MKIILTGGGTAGHVSPALALIENYKQEYYYFGNMKNIEYRLVNNKVNFININVKKLDRKNPFLFFITIYYIVISFFKSLYYIRKIKPDVIIGFGGYVTFPVLLAGSFLRKKTIIHEQNSVPGLSNKILSRFVAKIFLTFDDTREYFKTKGKCIHVGNPTSIKAKKYSKSSIYNKYIPNYKKVLFLGGSLGAKKINDIMNEVSYLIKELPIQIIGITGNYSVSNIEGIFLNYSLELTNIMNEVDLIISRAGASTIVEILSIPKPSILIPSPNVTNNHQLKNAKLVGKYTTIIEEDELNKENLYKIIIDKLYSDFSYLYDNFFYKEDSFCLFTKNIEKLLEI